MEWRQESAAVIRSEVGHVIREERRNDGGVQYFAWAPDIGREAHDRQLQVRYERGESVPLRRPFLGRFEAAKDAMAVCERHASDASAAGPSRP